MKQQTNDFNVMRLHDGAAKPGMPWNWLCQAAGIAPLRGEVATRSAHATGEDE
jgi:hypothetical protein